MAKTVEELLAEQNELLRQQLAATERNEAALNAASHRAYVEECAARWDRAHPVARHFFQNPVRR